MSKRRFRSRSRSSSKPRSTLKPGRLHTSQHPNKPPFAQIASGPLIFRGTHGISLGQSTPMTQS